MSEKIYDVVIIGSGPAGLTAAIYTSRAFLNTLVIGGNPPGGQLMLTTDVENFPGFPEGITGPELITNMRTQAKRFGAEVVDENVIESPSREDKLIVLKTDNGSSYKGRSLIIATGASARWLNIESEQKLRGKGVSACATCDGFFFKDKVIAVVGGGDAAMEEATFLTKFASKVYILVRKGEDQLRASKIMQKRAIDNPKIEFMFNTEVKEVLGEQFVTGLRLFNNATNEESELEVQGMFLSIGHKPNTDFLKGFVELDDLGYAVANKDILSDQEGVFIAGDVYDHKYRQAITASGFGTMAALEAEKYIAENYQQIY